MKTMRIYDDTGRNQDYTCSAIYEDDFIILALITENEASDHLSEADRRILINKQKRTVVFADNDFYLLDTTNI
jgi:hypothetical protein